MKIQKLIAQNNCMGKVETKVNLATKTAELLCEKEQIGKVCDMLFKDGEYHFSGLIVEERKKHWELSYLFVGLAEQELVFVKEVSPIEDKNFPSVSVVIHAADWYEREAEDLFGLIFEGHPRLGDFVLHDDVWQEGLEPMRKGFNVKEAIASRKPKQDWRPRRLLEAQGAFIMPVGPVFSGVEESVHFQLETIGEEIARVYPRLFYKYRGAEKLAEGKLVDNALLLAERFSGDTAFAHALAFCLTVEKIQDVEVPRRVKFLRIFFAELERARSHLGTIEKICSSTGLAVAASQVAILEEEILRISCYLAGHRYLFGLAVPGGLSRDCDSELLINVVVKIQGLISKLKRVESLLKQTNTFLDRIEEVGIVTKEQAWNYGMVGPVARGSGYCNDIRKINPYSGYEEIHFDVPCDIEGDGYARLRVLFAEIEQSVRIMEQVSKSIPDGSVFAKGDFISSSALAGVETPRGAAWHWVSVDKSGKIERYRIIPASFVNWHGFHFAAENFAFQDFPIILATFGLSVTENDR